MAAAGLEKVDPDTESPRGIVGDVAVCFDRDVGLDRSGCLPCFDWDFASGCDVDILGSSMRGLCDRCRTTNEDYIIAMFLSVKTSYCCETFFESSSHRLGCQVGSVARKPLDKGQELKLKLIWVAVNSSRMARCHRGWSAVLFVSSSLSNGDRRQ